MHRMDFGPSHHIQTRLCAGVTYLPAFIWIIGIYSDLLQYTPIYSYLLQYTLIYSNILRFTLVS